jgi:mediator of RNA polymerase II transcription subunit 12
MVQAKLRATRRKAGSPSEILQEQLFKWLDTSDMARDHKNNLDGVALLYGRLVEHGLFSYTQFIQKLMARGETGRFVDDGVSILLAGKLLWT